MTWVAEPTESGLWWYCKRGERGGWHQPRLVAVSPGMGTVLQGVVIFGPHRAEFGSMVAMLPSSSFGEVRWIRQELPTPPKD